MPRGGKRKGAGAPKGNKNAFKHGGRAKVFFGVALNKELTLFEYRALCLMQLNELQEQVQLTGNKQLIYKYLKRYKGAVMVNFNR
ncbi:hypothetical protein B0W48_12965 [Pseudoalteromonas aliena]|uniref:Uncharacterized protein n=1 Tax=Pseudoalteromonas aliena TaxID=247523 RepID=A0A1Q2GZV7_9GAMM|nr:hypothetical protein [Pseudoalteromonas aliena]AQQ00637.1 hypothetical protein B0W48_12965 [Pseudoalteromonas aliena]